MPHAMLPWLRLLLPPHFLPLDYRSDPLNKAGLVIWNEAHVGFLVVAVEQNEHFYVAMTGEVDAASKASSHDLGEGLKAVTVTGMKEDRLGISEILATNGLHQGLWN